MAKTAPWEEMTRKEKDAWVEQLISMDEAFELCGMEPKRDHVWAWALEMPSAHVAGEARFDRDEVLEWLEQRGGKESLRSQIEAKRAAYEEARKLPTAPGGAPQT